MSRSDSYWQAYRLAQALQQALQGHATVAEGLNDTGGLTGGSYALASGAAISATRTGTKNAINKANALMTVLKTRAEAWETFERALTAYNKSDSQWQEANKKYEQDPEKNPHPGPAPRKPSSPGV